MAEAGLTSDTDLAIDEDFAIHTVARDNYYKDVLDKTSTPESQAAYFRDSYKPQDPRSREAEYLDWLDDIAYVDTLRMELVKDFVYSYLAQRKQKIQCGDHHHIFYAGPNVPHDSEVIYTDENVIISPESDYSHDVCWYREIIQQIKEIPPETFRTAAVLPACNTKFLKGLTVQEEPDVKDEPEGSSSPVLPLTFQFFRQAWWSKGTVSEAEHALLEHPVVKTRLTSVNLTPPDPFRVSTPIVRHSSGQVILEHGLHALLVHSTSPGLTLALINESRTRCGSQYRLTINMVLKGMQQCAHCRDMAQKPKRALTQAGLYYAPPGAGKSTAQDMEILVAVDTDWLAEYSPSAFHETVAPFLFHHIPVLTNQHRLATNSGIKLTGVFNEAHLRVDPTTGLTYANKSDLQASVASQYPDLVCVFRRAPGHYYAREFLTALFLQYVAHHSQWMFFKRNKANNRFRPNHKDISVQRCTPQMLLKEITKYPVPWNAWTLTRPEVVQQSGKPTFKENI